MFVSDPRAARPYRKSQPEGVCPPRCALVSPEMGRVSAYLSGSLRVQNTRLLTA